MPTVTFILGLHQQTRRPRSLPAGVDQLRGGQVIGSSDKKGALPHDYPIKPPRLRPQMEALASRVRPRRVVRVVHVVARQSAIP